MPDFPTYEQWKTFASDQRGFLSHGSTEFNALDGAFKRYAEARERKDTAGMSIAIEYNALKNAFEVYIQKKESNKDSLTHLWGYNVTDRNEQFKIMDSLNNFFQTNNSPLTREEEKICVNYAFEKALRLRTSLAYATIQLKKGNFLKYKEKIQKWLGDTKTEASNTLSGQLKQAAEENRFLGETGRGTAKERLAVGVRQNLAEIAMAGNDARSAYSASVEAAQALHIVAASAPAPDTTSEFQKHIAAVLDVSMDHVFQGMMQQAKIALGPANFDAVISVIPVLNTITAVGNLAMSVKSMYDAHKNEHYCKMVRETKVVATGMAADAVAQIESLISHDFAKATQEAGENALKLAAGFDPTHTAGAVVGAATAVAHLIQGVIEFGKCYYQVENANTILSKWKSVALDGDESISFGLKGEDADTFKARRAIGGMSNGSTRFIEAMNECPLLSCYFIANAPTLDLLEILATDQQYNFNNSFFQTFQIYDSQRMERIKELAKAKLDASPFEIIQSQGKVHAEKSRLESENFERHQNFSALRVARLEGFMEKHTQMQQEKKRQFEADEAAKKVALKAGQKAAAELAIVMIIKKRQEAEARAAEFLRQTAETETRDTAVLMGRRTAIRNAIDKYMDETSGFAVLYTKRTPEATEAREVLEKLLKGADLPTLRVLDQVTTYLLTRTDAPTQYKYLRPLKKESRLKRLLQESYNAAR